MRRERRKPAPVAPALDRTETVRFESRVPAGCAIEAEVRFAAAGRLVGHIEAGDVGPYDPAELVAQARLLEDQARRLLVHAL